MNHCVKGDYIETENLLIEPLTPGHAEPLFESFRDPDLYHYIFWNVPESLDWLKERYRHICRGHSQDGKQIWLNWVPRLKSNQDYTGFYEATIEGDKAMLAYYTFRPYQRSGFAKEGILGVMDFVRQRYSVKKFILEMDTRNRPSVRLAESLGFVWEKTTNHACDLKGYQSHEFTFVYELELRADVLAKSDIRKYVAFRSPNCRMSDVETKVRKLQHQYSKGVEEHEKILVVAQANNLVASGSLLKFQPGVFRLFDVTICPGQISEEAFGRLLLFAKEQCTDDRDSRLEFQLIDNPESKYQEIVLLKQGFHFKHLRKEFRRDIDLLPDAMTRPFEKHNCKKYRSIQEWVFEF